jgi:hypothetical protein
VRSRELSLIFACISSVTKLRLNPDSPRDVIAALDILGRALDELE